MEANAAAHPALIKLKANAAHLLDANWKPAQHLTPPQTKWRCSPPSPDANWKPMQQLTPANNIKLPNVMYQPRHGIDMSLNFTSDKWLDWRACVKTWTAAVPSRTHMPPGDEVRRIWNLCFILFTYENKMPASDEMDDSGNAESPRSLIYRTRQVLPLCTDRGHGFLRCYHNPGGGRAEGRTDFFLCSRCCRCNIRQLVTSGSTLPNTFDVSASRANSLYRPGYVR